MDSAVNTPSRCDLTELPVEVLRRIAESLSKSSLTNPTTAEWASIRLDLLSLSRVNRLLHTISTPWLWAFIDLSSLRTFQLDLLYACLLEDESRRARVKALRLHPDIPEEEELSDGEADDSPSEDRRDTLVRDIVRVCTKTSEVCASGWIEAMAELVYFRPPQPAVTTLRWEDWPASDFWDLCRLLEQYAHLTTVELGLDPERSDLALADLDDPPDAPVLPVLPTTLQHLRLSLQPCSIQYTTEVPFANHYPMVSSLLHQSANLLGLRDVHELVAASASTLQTLKLEGHPEMAPEERAERLLTLGLPQLRSLTLRGPLAAPDVVDWFSTSPALVSLGLDLRCFATTLDEDAGSTEGSPFTLLMDQRKWPALKALIWSCSDDEELHELVSSSSTTPRLDVDANSSLSDDRALLKHAASVCLARGWFLGLAKGFEEPIEWARLDHLGL